MHIRIISFLIATVTLLMSDIMYGCVAMSLFILYFRRPYEIFVVTICIDALFSGPGHIFPYIYTAFGILVLLIKIPMRLYLRFHE